MYWILTLEILGIAYLLWFITCVGIYAQLEDTIRGNEWHWKLYSSIYSAQPPSDCVYVRRLIFLPITATAELLFVALICTISLILCLFIDWILVPIVYGERIIEWRSKEYWSGLVGGNLGKCKKGEWRSPQNRIKFLPFSPGKWIIIFFALFVLIYNGCHIYEEVEETKLLQYTSFSLASITILFMLYRNKEVISSTWRKWKGKTCRPLCVSTDNTGDGIS